MKKWEASFLLISSLSTNRIPPPLLLRQLPVRLLHIGIIVQLVTPPRDILVLADVQLSKASNSNPRVEGIVCNGGAVQGHVLASAKLGIEEGVETVRLAFEAGEDGLAGGFGVGALPVVVGVIYVALWVCER